MAARLNHEDYTVAWITVLPIEAEAALGILKKHDGYFEAVRGDDYIYIGGEINGHNVVVATWPEGQNYGVGAASALVSQVKARFPNIWFALLVGIAAGLPNLSPDDTVRRRDIRLGDVVVCVPEKASTGIIHYDLGKDTEAGFVLNGRQAETPAIVRAAIGNIRLTKKKPYKTGNDFAQHLEALQQTADGEKFQCPSQEKDQLFGSSLDADAAPTPVSRDLRDESERTQVWYGNLGSGNSMMRNPRRRDELRDQHDLIGLEMEAAGVMNTLPTGVIRGVCDYGDGQKNDDWQAYAAAVAAVYAKGILCAITPKVMRPHRDVDPYHRGLSLADAPVMDERLFVGRDDILGEMEAILLNESDLQERKVLVLGGVGGIGKSQLAIRHAIKHQAFYSSVFWLNATSEMTLLASLRRLGKHILGGQTMETLEDGPLWERLSLWLSEAENCRWLLVFDNYDEPDQYRIEKYWPLATHGSIIVSTRQPTRVNGSHIQVQKLTSVESGLQILAVRSERPNVHTDDGARELAKRLDGLPLALATAGAYLKLSSVSFSKYLEQYESKWRMTRRPQRELPDYQTRTLYTTWDLSLAHIEREMPDAAKLLGFLAYLDHQDIWYELLQIGPGQGHPSWFVDMVADEFEFEQNITILAEYCLVDTNASTESYSLHTCVHDWTLHGLNQNRDVELYWLAFDCVCISVANIGWSHMEELSFWSFSRVTPHAVRLAQTHFESVGQEPSWARERVHRVSALGLLLHKQRQYQAALRMFTWALDPLVHVSVRGKLELLDVVLDIGTVYFEQGKYDQAGQLYQQVLADCTEAYGPNDVRTLKAATNLGNVWLERGELDNAALMYNRVIIGSIETVGPRHENTFSAINNLATVYFRLGKYEDAKDLLERLLAVYMEQFGLRHIRTIVVIGTLADICRHQGKLDTAEGGYKLVIDESMELLGPNHKTTLNILQMLGITHLQQGKFDEAEPMLTQALAGYERTMGRDHVSTLQTVHDLAHLYLKMDRFDEARPLFLRAAEESADALGRDHLLTLQGVYNLAIFYNKAGAVEALAYTLQFGLEWIEEALGPDDPFTVRTSNFRRALLEKHPELRQEYGGPSPEMAAERSNQ